MLADYSTKALQRKLVRNFRAILMEYTSIDTSRGLTESSEIKRRVVIQEPVIRTVISDTKTQKLVVRNFISDEGQPQKIRTYADVVNYDDVVNNMILDNKSE